MFFKIVLLEVVSTRFVLKIVQFRANHRVHLRPKVGILGPIYLLMMITKLNCTLDQELIFNHFVDIKACYMHFEKALVRKSYANNMFLVVAVDRYYIYHPWCECKGLLLLVLTVWKSDVAVEVQGQDVKIFLGVFIFVK